MYRLLRVLGVVIVVFVQALLGAMLGGLIGLLLLLAIQNTRPPAFEQRRLTSVSYQAPTETLTSEQVLINVCADQVKTGHLDDALKMISVISDTAAQDRIRLFVVMRLLGQYTAVEETQEISAEIEGAQNRLGQDKVAQDKVDVVQAQTIASSIQAPLYKAEALRIIAAFERPFDASAAERHLSQSAELASDAKWVSSEPKREGWWAVFWSSLVGATVWVLGAVCKPVFEGWGNKIKDILAFSKPSSPEAPPVKS